MSVVIRLARAGTKKKPFYHFVAAEKRSCRDGRYLARLGTFNPKAKEGERVKVDYEAFQAWVKKGAQPTETVGHLVEAVAKSK